ncbi:MAG TPA: peptidylprolyl isomerase [Rhodocyclaceae bacterium]|nr:peptidylprolyl isomerase [Rhodocyclaceae bacterium]
MKCALAALILASQALVVSAAPQVELKTTAGTIVVDLNSEKAPKTVANFVDYVKAGHYNGVIFHRVIDGFMIQGGGFTPEMKEKPTRAPIQSESKNGLKNDAGTLAMARTQDPHSASAQFFINLVDNAPLNYPSPDGWGYTVFGKVVTGMDVVRKIGQTPTGNRGFYRDVPLEAVVIQSARVLPDAPAAK